MQFNDLREWQQTMIASPLSRVAQMMDAEHINASPILDIGVLDKRTPNTEMSALFNPRIPVKIKN